MTPVAAPPIPHRRSFVHAGLMALVLFAFSLWLNTRHNDFPFSYHPDEGGKTGQIIGGIRNYHHPLLMLSVTDLVSRVAFVPREPQKIVQTGRWVSAAFAAGTVVALALLAWLHYGPLVAWGAGLATALQVELFETAHYMKEDPALLFGIALSLLAATLWWQTPSRKTLRFLGIACGLAVSGKYLGIIVLLFALPMVLWRRPAKAEGDTDTDANADAEPTGSDAKTEDPLAQQSDPATAATTAALDRRARFKLFAVTFALTCLVCNLPLFATKLSSPFRSIGQEVQGVAGGHRGITRQVPHSAYLEMLHEDMPRIVLLLAAVYALHLLATARRRTVPEWVMLLFPLLYLAVISCSPKIADRYLLPVSVLLPFLAMLGVAELVRTVDSEKLPIRRCLSLGVLVALTAWIAFAELPAFRRAFDGYRHDDPAAVAEWIKANLPPDAVIVEDHRVNLSRTKSEKRKNSGALEFDASKDARILQKVYSPSFASELGSLDQLRANGVTHVAICKQSYGRYFRDETKPRESVKTGFDRQRDFYAQVLETELVKAWPPGKISYLQPGIKLFRITPPPPGE